MTDPYAGASSFQLECLAFDLALQLDLDYHDDMPRDPFGPPYDRLPPMGEAVHVLIGMEPR